MNVNRLYVAIIYVCTKKEIDPKSFCLEYGLPHYVNEWKGRFCKPAIVYHVKDNCYIDIETKEKYKLGLEDECNVGDMYINLKSGLKPLYTVFDVEFKKNNMSKKRIIRTLSRSKLLNKKEEDK
jgi:hypothetical protein